MSIKACSNTHIVIFVLKSVHSNAPHIFKEYFVKTSHNYSTWHNSLNIFVPKVSTETVKKGSYFFRAQAFKNLLSSKEKNTPLLIFLFKYCLYLLLHIVMFLELLLLF